MSEYKHERPRWERYLPFRRTKLRSYLVASGVIIGFLGLNRVDTASVAVGVVFMAFAAVVHVWAKGHLDKNKTLTRSGPYRWVRDPFHLSNFFMDLGLCLVVSHWIFTAVVMTLWVIAYSYRLNEEHEMLVEIFGDEYLQYRDRIPRMIPWRKPLDKATYDKPWSVRHAPIWHGKVCTRLFRLASYPYLFLAAAQVGNHGAGLLQVEAHPLFYWTVSGALFFHFLGAAAAKLTTRRAPVLPRRALGLPFLIGLTVAYVGALLTVDNSVLLDALPEWQLDIAGVAVAGLALVLVGGLAVPGRLVESFRFRRLVEGLYLVLLALFTQLPWLGLIAACYFSAAFLYGAPSRPEAEVERIFPPDEELPPRWAHVLWLVVIAAAGAAVMLN